MATYCTIFDVRAALAPSGDQAATDTAASLPDWQIEDAILEAEGIVNAFVSTRYAIQPVEFTEVVPGSDPPESADVTAAPSPLRGWTRDIAAYLAALTFRKHKDLGEDDPIRLRYTMVMGFLTSVRDRSMNLPLPGTDTDDQGVHVENLYVGRLFSMEDLGLGRADSYSQVQRYISRDQWTP